MDIHDTILGTIGHTPLVRLGRVGAGLSAPLLAKLEFMNPGGSVKDRIATVMIEDAERAGLLKPGGTLIEGTSGNTGVGLAMVAALKGYRCIFTMPDKMSQEKVNLLRAYGAEVVITPTAVPPDDPRSYYSVAKRLNREIPNSYYPNQYDNLSNPKAHTLTTGPEIWEQTDGKVTHVIAGMGTGGTISGVGRYLKERNPKLRVIGADPAGSLYTQYFREGCRMPDRPFFKTYKVEGIGEDILPKAIDFSLIDDVIQVSDKESFTAARRLCREEGIFAGGSSGTALHVALQVARGLKKDSLAVVILPDSGSRYLSTFYREEWMRQYQFLDAQVSVSAGDILRQKPPGQKRLLSVKSTDKVLVVIGQFKSLDFSQLPVIDDGQVVGSILEDRLIDALINTPNVGNLIVSEIMDKPLPTVSEEAGVEQVYELLRAGSPAVLVQGPAGLGIVTKSDLLRVASERR